MKKLRRKLILSLRVISLVALPATRSNAFILDFLSDLGSQIQSSFVGTLTYQLGGYVTGLIDHYLPIGLDVITGALGLPSPTELISQIEGEALENNTENSDVLKGEIDSSEATQRITRSLGESILDTEAQEITRAGLDGVGATVRDSLKIAGSVQGENITQNILKGIAGQNAQNAGLTGQLIGQQNQIMTLLAGLSLTSADTAEQLNKDERAEQAAADAEAAAIVKEAGLIDGTLDSKQ